MEIASIIDQELPSAHGNRKGLSYGQLSVLFKAYVVSQSDHRLCAVEPWVEKHRQTLEMATGWNIGVKDATDDRLERRFSNHKILVQASRGAGSGEQGKS